MRELYWMADGVRRDEWERASHLMAAMAATFSGKEVDPRRLNPYHREPPKTAAQEESESRQAFLLLGRALSDLSGA